MVKRLDDHDFPELLDHVGVDLWRAALAWKRAFDAGMVALGHPWFAQARSAVVPHVGRNGVRQSELVARLGMTKQAVQQLVDELEADGVVAREPDPLDRRGRIVVFAAKGRRVLADANKVKRRVAADLRARLGKARFEAMVEALRIVSRGETGPF